MSASDQFSEFQTALNSPATSLTSVTPNDATDLASITRAVHVTGTGGMVYITAAGMTPGTSIGIYIGQGGLFPVRVSRIWTTNTTATGIVAVY